VINLETDLAGIKLANPVTICSGVLGTGQEYAHLFDVSQVGGIFSKAVTLRACMGNPPPRVWETTSGLLNSIGLQNKGVDRFLKEDLPRLLEHRVPVIVNVAGFSEEEYVEVARRLDDTAGISGIELNISCPNVKEGGIHFGSRPESAFRLVKMVRERFKRPLLVKLSPQVYDIVEMAKAVVEAGADGLSLINTFPGMAVDVETWEPRLGNITGGLSGPAIHPLAVRAVWEVATAMEVPIVAMGGITCWEDAVEMLLVGATAVGVGTAIFANPGAPLEILVGLEEYLARKGLSSPRELMGKLKLARKRNGTWTLR
jgi:dihydroorotate dehydrogenase (NAD+) catalytic subunit